MNENEKRASGSSHPISDLIDCTLVMQANDALAAQSPSVADHRAMVNVNLALLSKFFEVREAKTGDENTIMLLGARVFNSSATALHLALSGYYQTAFMLLRDLIEVTNLLDYFLTNRLAIAHWRNASDRQLRKLFSPKTIRDALNARDQITRDVRNEYYSALSETAVHATFHGVRLLMHDDKIMVGPFSSMPLLESVLSLLPMFSSFGTQVFMRYFPDITDPAYLHTVSSYNAIFVAWQKKHVPHAVFRDE